MRRTRTQKASTYDEEVMQQEVVNALGEVPRLRAELRSAGE